MRTNKLVAIGSIGLLLAAVLTARARPWPDSSSKIIVFSDQLPGDLTEAQRRFVVSNLAGTQKMRFSEIQAIRAVNANFLCLHYQLAVGCGSEPFIIGDEWTTDWNVVDSHEGWFLHNPTAQRVHQTQWNWDVMDITYSGGTPNTAFPQYWITSCLYRIQAADDDGVFADSFTADGYGFGQSNPFHPWLEDTAQCLAHWTPSLQAYGHAIRAAFDADGRGYKFIPNMGGLVTGWDTMDYGLGHGCMIESFCFWGPDSYFDLGDWQLQMNRAINLVRSNKIVICQSYPSQDNYTERMFALCSYLLIKGSQTYFNMLATDMVALEYYPEYRVSLGSAVIPTPSSLSALWHASWGVYRRDYARGIVLVNPGDSSVNIPNLGRSYYWVSAAGGGVVDASGNYGGSLSYNSVSSINLPAHSGAVLLTSPGSLWAEATDLGGGWKWLNWFGYFYDAGSGWIYHNEHGWMYSTGISTASIWFWTSDMGWLWSNGTAYPFLFRASDPAWLWYQMGSKSPRWFCNMNTGIWESH